MNDNIIQSYDRTDILISVFLALVILLIFYKIYEPKCVIVKNIEKKN
jgi:hypothetical protein